MARPDLKTCLEETLTIAFACRDRKSRLAYLQLADFYVDQAHKEALKEGRSPEGIFR